MKILLSAFSCSPNRGSEPGIGWGFVKSLARDHELTVLTSSLSQEVIEAELEMHPLTNSVRFIYISPPFGLRKLWQKAFKQGKSYAHLLYFLWQVKLFFLVKRNLDVDAFDLIHHVTFGVFRTPSLLAFLGRPFIFGPLGGGEHYPTALKKQVPFRSRMKDIFRAWSNRLSCYNPLLHAMYRRCQLIICRNGDTQAAIPPQYHPKTMVEIGIGVDNALPTPEIELLYGDQELSGTLKLLFVGRPAYWKGLDFVLESFAHLQRKNLDISLSIVSYGNDLRYRKKAEALGIKSSINWQQFLSFEELIVYYQSHHLLVFPALRETGGNAILEAFANGLPVLGLNLGNSSGLLDNSRGASIPIVGLHAAQVTAAISREIERLYKDRSALVEMVSGAKIASQEYTYQAIVDRIYSEYYRRFPAMSPQEWKDRDTTFNTY